MNRPMMRAYLTKWIARVWKDIPKEQAKAAQEGFIAGYEQGHAQCKLEHSWRSINK